MEYVVKSTEKTDNALPETASSLRNDVDAAILNALCSGDHDAYKTVYYKYHKPLRRYLFALCRSEDLSLDLAQEVLLKVWEKRDTLRPEEGIARLLFSLARQTIIHHYRRTEVRESYARNLTADEQGSEQGDQILEAQEVQLVIDITVSRMPKIRQTVFRMSRQEGLSVEEIAARLNISRDSVSSHLYNALRDIRKAITVFVMVLLG